MNAAERSNLLNYSHFYAASGVCQQDAGVLLIEYIFTRALKTVLKNF